MKNETYDQLYDRLRSRRDIVGKILHGDDWAPGHDYDEHEETLLALAALLPSPDDIIIRRDGDKFMAVRGDFVNLQESKAWFADSEIIALSDLLADPTQQTNTSKEVI